MYALHTDTQMHVHRFINKKPKKKVYSCPQVVSGYIKYASNEQEDCPGLTPGYIDWTNVITQQHQKYNSSLTHTHTHTHIRYYTHLYLSIMIVSKMIIL